LAIAQLIKRKNGGADEYLVELRKYFTIFKYDRSVLLSGLIK